MGDIFRKVSLGIEKNIMKEKSEKILNFFSNFFFSDFFLWSPKVGFFQVRVPPIVFFQVLWPSYNALQCLNFKFLSLFCIIGNFFVKFSSSFNYAEKNVKIDKLVFPLKVANLKKSLICRKQ